MKLKNKLFDIADIYKDDRYNSKLLLQIINIFYEIVSATRNYV